jgi:hypothetical protein
VVKRKNLEKTLKKFGLKRIKSLSLPSRLREAGFRTKLKKKIAKSKNNFGRIKKVITFATPIEKSGTEKERSI